MRPGESARVGCSPWVECYVPDHESLSEEHFQIDYLGSISIRPIGHAKIEVFSPGQNPRYQCNGTTVTAGGCVFVLRTQVGQPAPELHSSISSTTLERGLDLPVWQNKESVLEMAMLSEQASQCASAADHPAAAIHSLENSKLREDAVRLLASVLTPLDRIRWCVDGLGFAQIPSEFSVRQLLQSWIDAPNETNRTLVEQQIAAANAESPWTWCMKAIAWLGGSLAPKGFAIVPPPSRLSVSAVITAMQLASSRTDPDAFRAHVVQQGSALIRSSKESGDHATSR